MTQPTKTSYNELLEALIEASNIFDNYPEIAKELVGTYEVVNKAILNAETK